MLQRPLGAPDPRLGLSSFGTEGNCSPRWRTFHDLGYEGFETNFASLAEPLRRPHSRRARGFAKRGVPLIGLHMGAALFETQQQIAQVARASLANKRDLC